MATTHRTTTTNATSSTSTKVISINQRWSAEARRERSLELAEERGGGMWAVHCGALELDPETGELVHLEATIESAHDSNVRYLTTYDAQHDLAFCTCRAAANFGPCWHAGQMLLYGRTARDAYAPEGCATTRGEQHQAWINEDPLPPVS